MIQTITDVAKGFLDSPIAFSCLVRVYPAGQAPTLDDMRATHQTPTRSLDAGLASAYLALMLCDAVEPLLGVVMA